MPTIKRALLEAALTMFGRETPDRIGVANSTLFVTNNYCAAIAPLDPDDWGELEFNIDFPYLRVALDRTKCDELTFSQGATENIWLFQGSGITDYFESAEFPARRLELCQDHINNVISDSESFEVIGADAAEAARRLKHFNRCWGRRDKQFVDMNFPFADQACFHVLEEGIWESALYMRITNTEGGNIPSLSFTSRYFAAALSATATFAGRGNWIEWFSPNKQYRPLVLRTTTNGQALTVLVMPINRNYN